MLVSCVVFLHMVWTSTRHQLNVKKTKGDDQNNIKKQKRTYAPQHLAALIANASNNEGLIEESISLSKSLMGGSMNVCKMRILSFFVHERVLQGLS